MTNITNYLNKIKTAVYGKDVRGAIHDAIKQVYDDASVEHDNANMEVKLARGTHNTLNDRLDNVDEIQAQTNAQLSRKANKDDVFSMANMGQDIREAMTGGSVAVVDGYSVHETNVVDGSISPSKLDYFTNLINKNEVEMNKVLTPPSFVTSELFGYALTDFIPVSIGSYSINFSSHDTIFIFDKNKSGLKCITTSSNKTKFDVEENGYVRLVIKIDDLDGAMMVHGDLPNEYVPYGCVKWLKIKADNLDGELFNKIEDSENKITKITNEFNYVNLFNVNTITDRVMLNYPSDNLSDNPNFCVSDYISVSTGNYTLNIANYDTVFMYDKTKTLISKLSLSGWGIVTNTITIPEDIKFIRLSVLNEHKNKIMLAKGDTLPHSYIPYGKFTMNGLVIENNNNFLRGKTALFTGDSICYGAGSTGGYAKYIGENNQMNVVNYGISGSRIAETEDRDDSIVKRIASMQDNADYICLEGGVNDAWCGKVPLGEISNGFNGVLDESTFTGAFESLLKQSIIKWQTAKIFYIIPHKMVGVDEYMNRAKEICEKWGIPCLDLRLMTGIFAYVDEMKQTYTANGDGVHPNEQGYKNFYVDKITAFMKSL